MKDTKKTERKQNILVVFLIIVISLGTMFFIYNENKKQELIKEREPVKTLYTYIPEEEILVEDGLYDITRMDISKANQKETYRINEILIKIDCNSEIPETENCTPDQLLEKYKNIALENKNKNVITNYKVFSPTAGTNYVQIGLPVSEQEFYKLSKQAEKENKKIVAVKSIEKISDLT